MKSREARTKIHVTRFDPVTEHRSLIGTVVLPRSNSTVPSRGCTLRVMPQDSAQKDGQESVAIARAERGRFAAGHKGGPGRPKRGETRAEQVRRNVDWEGADARMVAIIANPKSKDTDAIAAYNALNDRAWGKPLSSHELRVNPGDSAPADGERIAALLTDAELAMFERIKARVDVETSSETDLAQPAQLPSETP